MPFFAWENDVKNLLARVCSLVSEVYCFLCLSVVQFLFMGSLRLFLVNGTDFNSLFAVNMVFQVCFDMRRYCWGMSERLNNV